jgi:flagellar biosynthesis protein FlhG
MQNEFNKPFIFAVISGKGGVGKSLASVMLADMLQHMNYSVLLIDADSGFSNCSTLLNEPATSSVAQWIEGHCSLEEIPQQIGGISLITASDDPADQSIAAEYMMDALDQVVQSQYGHYDFIIIDTPAGAGEMTLWALDQADLGTLILVDEPTAISDVYRLCKYIYSMDPEYPFTSIVNFAEDEASAESTFERFNKILSYFLNKRTTYLGFIPASKKIQSGIRSHDSLFRSGSDGPIANELHFISQKIVGLANQLQKPIPNKVS